MGARWRRGVPAARGRSVSTRDRPGSLRRSRRRARSAPRPPARRTRRSSRSRSRQIAQASLDLIADHEVDFTGFWRDLAAAAEGDERPLRGRFLGQVPELDAWLVRWSELVPDAALIRATNPLYIARNHIVEEVLLAATEGDLEPFERLLGLLRDPYTQRAGREYRRFSRPAPDGTPRHRTFCGT